MILYMLYPRICFYQRSATEKSRTCYQSETMLILSQMKVSGKKSDPPEQILPSDPQALMDLEIKVSVSQSTQPPSKLIFKNFHYFLWKKCRKQSFWSIELAQTKVLPKIDDFSKFSKMTKIMKIFEILLMISEILKIRFSNYEFLQKPSKYY